MNSDTSLTNSLGDPACALKIIESILEEWDALPDDVKETDEAMRLKEVVYVFDAWFLSYIELLSEFNTRFNEKMDELERQLFRF